MKLRLCAKCNAALQDSPDAMIVARALAELGHWRCPFQKLMCGRFVDASGKVLAVTELSVDSIWLNLQ
jgi:hypothetical protein